MKSCIKMYRQENGMTQKDLAAYLGTTQNTVSQYETGRRCPSVKKLHIIAKALNCTIADLLIENQDLTLGGNENGATKNEDS